MRKVQINIKMTMVDDQAADGKFEEISVYADSNNLWETIVAGFHETIEALRTHGHRLPVFGAKEHYEAEK